MKVFRLILAILCLLPSVVQAQEVRILEDESCGCDIVLVDGIETTRGEGRYGFRHEDGRVIVPNIYLYVGTFQNGYCKVMYSHDSVGLIDSTGFEVVPCRYHDVEMPSNGRVLVYKDDRYGYTDMLGREVVSPRYLKAGSYSEGYAPVYVKDSLGARCFFIDTLGHPAFDAYYDNIQPFTSGWAPVCRNKHWGLIDHTGRVVLPVKYEQLVIPFDTLFFAGSAAGMALFDRRMQPLTPFVYFSVGGISDHRILVQREGHYGFLDPTGREAVPCIYDETGIFTLGRTMARIGDRYGIIDTAGRVVLPLEYEKKTAKGRKYMYYDSLALVEKEGRLGYIDIDGKLVIPFYFEEAFHFSEGLAAAKYEGLWGYVDTHGDIFMPFIFELAEPFRYGRAEVIFDGIVRKVNRQGKCVRNCKGIIAWRDWKE